MGTFQISNIPASKVCAGSIFSFIDKSPNMLQGGMILHILKVDQQPGRNFLRIQVNTVLDTYMYAAALFQLCQKCVLINYYSIMHGDVVYTRYTFKLKFR